MCFLTLKTVKKDMLEFVYGTSIPELFKTIGDTNTKGTIPKIRRFDYMPLP